MKKIIVGIFWILIGILAISLIAQNLFYTKVEGRLVPNTPVPTSTPSTIEIIGVVAEDPIKHNSVVLVRIDV